MSGELKVSVAQRRGRLMARHRLSCPAATVTEAVAGMVALHATDPVTVYLSARARFPGTTIEAFDEALYGDRVLLRLLGMRRTMFVVPADLAAIIQAACTDDVARRMRRHLERDLSLAAIGGTDPAGWLRDVGEAVVRALTARGGGASGAQLSDIEPRLRTPLVSAADNPYGGPVYITSRVLILLAAEGHLVRGNRRGGWSSGQFEWFPAASWRGPDAGPRPDASTARAELARRWLAVFGPALPADLQWWAGWTGGQTKAALAALPVRAVDLDGQAGVLLSGDEAFDSDSDADPVAVLLPGLDPTPMGWQRRDWFLGEHRDALFDRTGNIGPTIWWAGRVVGGWAQRPSGEVVGRLLEDAGADAAVAVAAEAARLESWLGPARVTPRFRTPLERELAG